MLNYPDPEKKITFIVTNFISILNCGESLKKKANNNKYNFLKNN